MAYRGKKKKSTKKKGSKRYRRKGAGIKKGQKICLTIHRHANGRFKKK